MVRGEGCNRSQTAHVMVPTRQEWSHEGNTNVATQGAGFGELT